MEQLRLATLQAAAKTHSATTANARVTNPYSRKLGDTSTSDASSGRQNSSL